MVEDPVVFCFLIGVEGPDSIRFHVDTSLRHLTTPRCPAGCVRGRGGGTHEGLEAGRGGDPLRSHAALSASERCVRRDHCELLLSPERSTGSIRMFSSRPLLVFI